MVVLWVGKMATKLVEMWVELRATMMVDTKVAMTV